ncbi:hypothetical protein BDZ91DRAFT_767700 [Kalaharituber pfeilii]|nr:hypothetical protein BDZ91DRAFT_767700 [Kalaharituber pfeilii]
MKASKDRDANQQGTRKSAAEHTIYLRRDNLKPCVSNFVLPPTFRIVPQTRSKFMMFAKVQNRKCAAVRRPLLKLGRLYDGGGAARKRNKTKYESPPLKGVVVDPMPESDEHSYSTCARTRMPNTKVVEIFLIAAGSQPLVKHRRFATQVPLIKPGKDLKALGGRKIKRIGLRGDVGLLALLLLWNFSQSRA